MVTLLDARIQAARGIVEEEDLKRGGVIVMRFLGTTPFCSNVSALLRSLVEQLKRAYDKDQDVEIPTDFGKLKSLFYVAVTR